MIASGRLVWIVLAALALSLSTATPARAQSPVQSEVQGLRMAYVYLSSGNHDYKGHRANALKSVETACKMLGYPIKGDGDSKQQQRASDTKLADAKAILQSVRETATSQGQPEVVKHLNSAIKEIDIALTIK